MSDTQIQPDTNPSPSDSILARAEVGHHAILQDGTLVEIQGVRHCQISGNAVMTKGGQWIAESRIATLQTGE